MTPIEKPFAVVSVLDDAIDTEAMPVEDVVRYFENRDMSILKVKPGHKLQVYHLREIKHSMMEPYVMATDNVAERNRRAFMCAVVQVDNLHQRDGSIMPWAPANVHTAHCMLDADVERFSARDRAEIGAVAFERSFLAPATVKAYPLSPMLRSLLAQRAFLSADAIQQSPAPSSANPSSGSAAAETPPSGSTASAPTASGSVSVNPTAATVPAPSEGA